VEWWFNGSSGYNVMGLFRRVTGSKPKREQKVEEEDDDTVVVNGESVERDVERERRVAGIRMGVFGLGFGMGVVGVWGDGAK
jgi:autophagy-related protein 33